MRFLADECCDFAAVRALREDGHDVLAVQHSFLDKAVLALAVAENRILLTEDRTSVGSSSPPGRIRLALS